MLKVVQVLVVVQVKKVVLPRVLKDLKGMLDLYLLLEALVDHKVTQDL